MPTPFAAPGTPLRWLRAKTFVVAHLDLEITIDPARPEVHGVVSHRLRWIGPARTVATFDCRGPEILSVQVDDLPTTWRVDVESLVVDIPPGGAERVVRIAFRSVRPRKGLVFTPPGESHGAIVWSQGAMEDHSWWFPCLDTPNNRSTWTVRLRHPLGTTALSNGVRIDHGADGESAWTAYRLDRPTALYLLTIVAGDLVGVDDPDAGVACTHWVPRGMESAARSTFRATGFAIRWLADYLATPFPYPRYGHAVAPDFWWGGMENATLTTIAARALADAATQERVHPR